LDNEFQAVPATEPPAVVSCQTIGHRGYSAVAPENTLAGLRAALETGVSRIEVDVRCSKDNVPVLLHDETVDRTTNGRGPCRELNAAELGRLDAGILRGGEFRGEPVPTLAAALSVVRARARLLLDIKESGLAPWVAKALADENLSAAEAVEVLVWDDDQLGEFAEKLPDAPRYLSGSGMKRYGEKVFAALKDEKVAGFSLDYRKADPRFIQAALAAGFRIYLWTVNDPAVARRLAELGVHGVITDNIREVQEMLTRTTH